MGGVVEKSTGGGSVLLEVEWEMSPVLGPAVGLLGHKAVLFPVFKGISILFSIVAVLT